MTQRGVMPSFYRIILSVSGCHAMAVRKVSPDRQNRRASSRRNCWSCGRGSCLCAWGWCTVHRCITSWLVFSGAGQCRTNPWPAVPDWTLMPECRCRTEAADYRKKCWCRPNFSLAFRHLHMMLQYYIARMTYQLSIDVQGVSLSTTYNLDVHWVSLSPPPTAFLNAGRTVRHPVSPVPEWTKIPMPEPVRYRNKGTWDTGCRNTDAGGIELDADAQLWYLPQLSHGEEGGDNMLAILSLLKYHKNIRYFLPYKLCVFCPWAGHGHCKWLICIKCSISRVFCVQSSIYSLSWQI
jgi:hypothetical protein